MAQFSLTIDLSSWQTWVVPLAGLLSTCATLLAGKALLRRRRALAPPQAKEAKTAPDPFEVGSATERRISLRRSGRLIEVYISDQERKLEPVKGWVMDRSMGGLCLCVPEAWPVKSIISVRAIGAPDTIPWVLAEIKRCDSQDKHYELGCRFLNKPSWGVLLLFG